MRPVIAILGPTATGKTAAGVLVAGAVDGEIISCDSMAVYRGMDIGTAKPSAEERAAARFHLIDEAEPNEPFNVALYKERASAALLDIEKRGKRAILVGGTGLYARVVLEGFGLTETPGNPAVRARLEREAQEHGAPALHRRLLEVDPLSAARIHPNDRVRIARALEVFEATGKPISQHQQEDATRRERRPSVRFGLTAGREELYRRIDARVDAMIAVGLVEEVQGLLRRGYGRDLPPLRSLGYKEIAAHLRGETTLEVAVEEIKHNTRRFAKRQLTWFRTDSELTWIDVESRTASDVARVILGHLPLR